MSVQQQASPAEIVGVGLAFAAGGIYFVLVALGVLPEPSQNAGHAPPVIVLCIGLAFLFAGLTCVVRARAGMTGQESEVPDGAPLWTRVSYRVLAIGAAGALAIIGTWIAIGSGPRAFSISAPFVEMRTAGEAIGRTVFALGAVIAWIYVIALTVSTARKFFSSYPSPSIVPSERTEQRPPSGMPTETERLTTP